MGPSRCDFRASHNYGIRSAFSPCRGSAQELVHRTIARCTCRGADLAGWFMGDWGSMGAALGSSWRAIPVCPPGRGCTRIDWANPDGGIQVGGLGTSSLRFGSVCGHRSCGRLLVAALSDEAHSQGTHVGVYSGTACPGIVIPFWGVLLAPPLLAVVYAYKARQERNETLVTAQKKS